MFHMADEAYTTKNAIDELKKISTRIIKSNNTDGVRGGCGQKIGLP